jgi:hypothetical protein
MTRYLVEKNMKQFFSSKPFFIYGAIILRNTVALVKICLCVKFIYVQTYSFGD